MSIKKANGRKPAKATARKTAAKRPTKKVAKKAAPKKTAAKANSADPRYSRNPVHMLPRLSEKLVTTSEFVEHIKGRAALTQYNDPKVRTVCQRVAKHLDRARQELQTL